MSNLIKQMENEAKIEDANLKRAAEGLPPVATVEEADAWLKSKAEVKPVEQAAQPPPEQKPEEQKPAATPPADEGKTFEAPVFKKAEAPADARVAELERELQRYKSEDGRAAKLAQQVRELTAQLEQANTLISEATQRAEAAQAKAAGGWLNAFMSEEDQAEVNPKVLAAIEKGVSKLVQQAVGEVQVRTQADLAATRQQIEARERAEQERAAAAQQAAISAMWRDTVSKAIPASVYGKLAGNPKWEEWCGIRFAGKLYGDLYNDAVADADGDAVIDLLNKALKFAGIEIPAKPVEQTVRVDSKSGVVQPNTAAGAQKPKYYAHEVNAIMEARVRGKLPAGWTVKQYDAWEADVWKAQDEGRIVDRNGNPTALS